MNKTRRNLYKAARIIGDVQAVRRGRIIPRLLNKLIGRLIRGLWR